MNSEEWTDWMDGDDGPREDNPERENIYKIIASLAAAEKERDRQKDAAESWKDNYRECLARAEAAEKERDERYTTAATTLIKALDEENANLQRSITRHFHEEHLSGDGPEIDRWKARAEAAEKERDNGRFTISRLNRRCQEAESAAMQNVEACRAAGVSFGRSLGNWYGAKLGREKEVAESRLRELRNGAVERAAKVIRAQLGPTYHDEWVNPLARRLVDAILGEEGG